MSFADINWPIVSTAKQLFRSHLKFMGQIQRRGAKRLKYGQGIRNTSIFGFGGGVSKKTTL